MRWIVLVLSLIASVPGIASAVTVDQVVAMSKSGASEAVILALIERDQTLFSLSAEQLVRLQREGVSDTVLLAMLKSGKAEPIAPAASAAPASVVQRPPGPDVVIVGHGPQRPNAGDDVSSAYPAVGAPGFQGVIPIPVGVPYVVPGRRRGARRVSPVLPAVQSIQQSSFCVSPSPNVGVPPLLTPINECSAVSLAPSPRRR